MRDPRAARTSIAVDAGSRRREEVSVTPQDFEVVVRGRMTAEMVAALDGFTIEPGVDGFTRVVGRVSDQPRLLGLLAAFDDLHIEVVSVNPVSIQE
jgi:hypothetical protein